MAFSPPLSHGPLGDGRLSPLQWDLLLGFFSREQRFYLTGGAALAGFYLGLRETEDLDLFSPPGPDLADAERSLRAAAAECGARVERIREYPDFRRLVAVRADATCVVDLVIDPVPMIDPDKTRFGLVRADTLREIAANKVCTLLGRRELKDLVDLMELLAAGHRLEQALADAERKEGGVDPATIAWLLGQFAIADGARLPGGVDPVALAAFRDELAARLRAIAFARAKGEVEPG